MTSCFRNANDPPAIDDTRAKLRDSTVARLSVERAMMIKLLSLRYGERAWLDDYVNVAGIGFDRQEEGISRSCFKIDARSFGMNSNFH